MKERLAKLTEIAVLMLVILKLGALLYCQVKILEATEQQITQQFLTMETFRTELQKVRTATPQETLQSQQPRYSLKDSLHEKHIDRIESEAGMGLRRVCEHIMRDEGKSPDPYPDNIGVAIGVGRNLSTYGISTLELRAIHPEADVTAHLDNISIGEQRVYIDDIETAKKLLNTPLNDHHIALLLLSNLRNVAEEAESVFQETWQTLDGPRKESIVDVLFNLGLPNFREFKNFIKNIKGGNFDQAANDLLLSLAAEQNPTRYQRNASVIRTGDPKYFELD